MRFFRADNKSMNNRDVNPRPGQIPAKPNEIVISRDGNVIDFIYNSTEAEKRETNVTRIKIVGRYKQQGELLDIYGNPYIDNQYRAQPLVKALVSWYSTNDAEIVDRNRGGVPRKEQYSEVVLGLDLPKIYERDYRYCVPLFTQLLDQKRVKQYLDAGLSDDANKTTERGECGNYVGHVGVNNQGKFGKVFEAKVGRIVHNSPEMVEKRRRHYQDWLSKLRQEENADNEAIRKHQRRKKEREAELRYVKEKVEKYNSQRDGQEL